ncbi:MAG: hypothetical protein ACFFHD_11520 [Promethearchaeota archaeon]
MVVREAGVLFRGFTLVKKTFHKSDKGQIDPDLRSGLLTAIISFAQTAISKDSIEYLEGKKYVITFLEDKIKAEDSNEPEDLMSYVILDKDKKIEKYIRKIIRILLKRVIDDFKSLHSGKNLSEISRFKDFKQNLDTIFGTDSQTVDQKLKGVFS